MSYENIDFGVANDEQKETEIAVVSFLSPSQPLYTHINEMMQKP